MESGGPGFRTQLVDAFRHGDMFALFERAREAMLVDPQDPDARYFQVLALARLGDPRAALRLYERNRVGEISSEDALALRGRLLKDLAIRARGAERVELFRQSSRAYLDAHELSDGYFSCVNAATTALLAGDLEQAADLADEILGRPDIAKPEDFFAAASGAEATLVRGDVERATWLYFEARRRPDASPGMIASTARQVALIAGEVAIPDDQKQALLASIRPTPVIHYAGHMFRSGWEPEEEISRAVRSILDEQDVWIAYGPLACGADIVIAEAVLERGGELHLVYPFAEEDFIRTSVTVGGPEWLPRYERARAAASSITFATEMRYVGDDQLFAYCSRLVTGLAQLRASMMQAETFQLVAWDGVSSDGLAGTGADYVAWQRQGGASHIVPVPRDRPPLDDLIAVDVPDRPTWTLQSMLFADFAGFSRVGEDRLSQFLEVVMGRIARVLDQHVDSVLTRNSWGDAIYVVISSPAQAARIALEIQAELSPDLLRSIGLPADGGMRISLHHGPIFEHYDAVQKARTFYGTEVTVAARIEPRVPVGSIYTTQPFAAMIEGDRNKLSFEYVGRMDLAKNYGARVLYRLATSH